MGGRPDSLECLHAELMGTLRRLPSTPAVGVQSFGPAADEVERFVSLLRDQPATVWERAEEYRHNLELNPAVHEELVSKYRSLLDLGMRTGRSASLRSAAEAALDALPTPGSPGGRSQRPSSGCGAQGFLLALRCAPSRCTRCLPTATRLCTATRPSAAEPSRAGAAASRPVQAAARQPTGLTFADVGGLEDVKARLRNALGDVLANPQVAAKLSVRVGAILLYGPPGNGKSYLARATAGEFKAQPARADTS